jgi:hypothetical protein
MTLLDELKTGLPADNILVVLHQCLDAKDTRGLPLTNDLVKVVRFRRIPPSPDSTGGGVPSSAAAAEADGADRTFRLSLQIGWNLLTKLRLDVSPAQDQSQMVTGIVLVSRINEALEAALKAIGAVREATAGPPSKAERRLRRLLRG